MKSRSVAVSERRVGAQQPRVKHVPAYKSSSGWDAVDLFESIGFPLDEWQQGVLVDALGERPDGRWSAFEVGLIVPRQNGKNFILEARELAGVLFFGDREVIHSAHRLDTARNAFRYVESKVRETPALLERVQGYRGQDRYDPRIPGIRTGAGEMSIQFENGGKISWRARAEDGGRGLTGDLVVLDEAFDLTAEQVASMMPTMAARSLEGNPQIWYTSSAGKHDSEQLANLRERGMSGDEARLAYFEWSADDDAESDDVDAWYAANPALGIRISEEYVAETEFSAMDDEQFRRERLGIWAPVGAQTVFTRGDWKKHLDTASIPGDVVAFGLDVPPERDQAVISVAGLRDDGKIHVEIVDQRVGTSWVAKRLFELQESWSPVATVVEAGSAAGALLKELKREGVRVMEVTARDYQQACGLVFDEIKKPEDQTSLIHIGQAQLDDAVLGASLKFKGETLFLWARGKDGVNVSPLAALTLAWLGLTSRGMKRKTHGKTGSGWRVVAL